MLRTDLRNSRRSPARWTAAAAFALGCSILIAAMAAVPPAGAVPPQPEDIPAPGLPDRVRMPAEFENQQAIALGCAQMVQFHPQTIVEMVAALSSHVTVLSLVGFAAERDSVARLLLDADLPGSVTFLYLPVMSMWARDYGPLTVVDEEGRPFFVDPAYRSTRGND
ncbi:MAG: agmatine deiminase family protein, partial [Candidatus Krumholzibacteriia bacterium]